MEKNALKVITDAMLEKKGQGVVSLDLSPDREPTHIVLPA